MIPKKIHYCWFGRNPLPEDAKKCIASWRKFFPDYEIIEWNEDNFDVDSIPYTSQAYQAKKYAFVSDYARFKILYEQGGLYFDTDVEVIKPFEDILEKGGFMGRELLAKDGGDVAPGLGLAVEAGHAIYKDLLEAYSKFSFLNEDGTLNETTIVKYTTGLLRKHGLETTDKIQKIEGIVIYPTEYFNPLDDLTGKLTITHNTHSIHKYSRTWRPKRPLRKKISRLSHRLLGVDFTVRVRKIFKLKF